MQDRTQLVAVVVGAVLGAAAGYLFFTEPGRRLAAELEHVFERAMAEAHRINGLASRVSRFAGDEWRTWQAMTQEASNQQREHAATH